MLSKIKHLLDSPRKLVTFYLSSLVVSTVLFALFESRNLWDAFWWATMTGLGVGYADILPQTFFGELLTIVWAHFMLLGIVPLVVGYIILNHANNKNEFTHAEQEEILSFVRKQKK